jgi:RND family efflux transporter MFP subunit
MNRGFWIVALAAAGCEKPPMHAAQVSPTGAGAPQAVRLVRPQLEKLAADRWTPGQLEPFEQVTLAAKLRGYLRELRADLGDRVQKGAVLARLDIPEMKGELDLLRARITEAKAKLDRALAARALQAVVTRRLVELSRRAPDAIALHEVEKARAELDLRDAAVKVAQSAIGAREAALRRGDLMVGYLTVRAPWAGAIARRHVHPGVLLEPGQPILTLVRASPLRLAVDLPEPDVGRAPLGSPAIVELDAFPGKRFEGRIARKAASLDAATHTQRVEIELPNIDGALTPGLYARVRLREGPPIERLTLPPEALVREGDKTFVFIAKDGRAVRRAVVKGLDTGASVEIRGGLTAMEDVVVAGQAGLREGDPIGAPLGPRP